MHFWKLAFVVLAVVGLGACGDDKPSTTDMPGLLKDPQKRTSTKPPMDKAAYEALVKTQIDGFTGAPGYMSDTRAVVQYAAKEKNAAGGTMKATVAFQPAGLVGWMDPDYYKGKEELFLKGLDSKHRGDPNLVWNYGALELAGGRQGVAQYVRSFVKTMHEGREMRHPLNSYTARYHDGVNGISMTLYVHGTEHKSAADLERNMTKETGDEVARKIFAAFADKFD